MRETPTYLLNCQAVVDAFGYWPGFHDSPVLLFEREADRIAVEAEAWEMGSEVDEKGYFILKKRHRIRFVFRDIVRAEVDGFQAGNILFELSFSPVAEERCQGHFVVDLDSAIDPGMCGRFTARSGEVAIVRSLEAVED